jgi:hypothetical protein
LNLQAVRELMVKASSAFEAIRSRAAESSAPAEFKELATASCTLMEAVGAIVELAIIPMADSSVAAPGSTTTKPNPPTFTKPRIEPGTAELKAALTAAEKSAVVFDVDLGQSAIANRNTLNSAFTEGIKKATLATAETSNDDVDEAVRLVNDALSCVDNMDFLGQTTSRKIDKRDPENPKLAPFFSMPIRLDFPDRGTRMNFERTMRSKCNIRAVMSLPGPLRNYQSVFLRALRERYPGRTITARPDLSTLSMVAVMKNDGSPGWSRCLETQEIPRGILLPGFVIPTRIALPAVQVPQGGVGCDSQDMETAVAAPAPLSD